jgi:hypothetical protein
VVALSSFFLSTELRQILYHGIRYPKSPYNWIDLAAFTLSLVTALGTLGIVRENTKELVSAATIFLWLHFLLQTRIYKAVGVFVNVVIEVALGIVPFLLILLLMLIAFSNALWVLLSLDDRIKGSDLAKELGSDYASYWWWLKYVFLALTSDYILFSKLGLQVPVVDVYRALFALITVIFLMNILIALLNYRYAEAYQRSENVWMLQKAQLISEIEVFYMTPWERRDPNKFPKNLLYDVSLDTFKKHHDRDKPVGQAMQELKSELDELKKNQHKMFELLLTRSEMASK